MQIDYKFKYKLRTNYSKSDFTKYRGNEILWLRMIDIFNIKLTWKFKEIH
jgi:hypothetical protein